MSTGLFDEQLRSSHDKQRKLEPFIPSFFGFMFNDRASGFLFCCIFCYSCTTATHKHPRSREKNPTPQARTQLQELQSEQKQLWTKMVMFLSGQFNVHTFLTVPLLKKTSVIQCEGQRLTTHSGLFRATFFVLSADHSKKHSPVGAGQRKPKGPWT